MELFFALLIPALGISIILLMYYGPFYKYEWQYEVIRKAKTSKNISYSNVFNYDIYTVTINKLRISVYNDHTYYVFIYINATNNKELFKGCDTFGRTLYNILETRYQREIHKEIKNTVKVKNRKEKK